MSWRNGIFNEQISSGIERSKYTVKVTLISILFSEASLTKFRSKLESVMVEWPTKLSFLVLIAMKRRANPEKVLPEWEEISAVAMAVQNFQLMATGLDSGVGVFWSSHTWCKDARDSKEIKEHFGFEEEDRIFGALTVARYDTEKKFSSVRGDIRQKVQFHS